MDALDLISVDHRTTSLASYEGEASQKRAIEVEGKRKDENDDNNTPLSAILRPVTPIDVEEHKQLGEQKDESDTSPVLPTRSGQGESKEEGKEAHKRSGGFGGLCGWL